MARGPTDQLFVLGRVEDLSQLEDERRGLESALWFFWLHYKQHIPIFTTILFFQWLLNNVGLQVIEGQGSCSVVVFRLFLFQGLQSLGAWFKLTAILGKFENIWQVGLGMQSMVLLRWVVTQLIVLEADVPLQRRVRSVETRTSGAHEPLISIFWASPLPFLGGWLLTLLRFHHLVEKIQHQILFFFRLGDFFLEMLGQLRQARELRLVGRWWWSVERESRGGRALGFGRGRYFLVNLAPLSSFERQLILRINELHVKQQIILKQIRARFNQQPFMLTQEFFYQTNGHLIHPHFRSSFRQNRPPHLLFLALRASNTFEYSFNI